MCALLRCYLEFRQFEANFPPKKLKLRRVAKNVAKFESGSWAGLKYYTDLNSSLRERVDQINSKTVNRQKTETYVVKNPKPSK